MRNTIQCHCSETKSYGGRKDIFYSVYGLGEGYWGLKDMKDKISSNDITPIEKRMLNKISDDYTLDETEKESIIKSRVGQGKFRREIIEKYKKCIITGITDERLLVASHIKPWRLSDNNERLSKENGLLLSPLYDKLFDIGLISFDEDMKVLISKDIEKDINKLNLNRDIKYIKDASEELKRNMEYHRNNIFK